MGPSFFKIYYGQLICVGSFSVAYLIFGDYISGILQYILLGLFFYIFGAIIPLVIGDGFQSNISHKYILTNRSKLLVKIILIIVIINIIFLYYTKYNSGENFFQVLRGEVLENEEFSPFAYLKKLFFIFLVFSLIIAVYGGDARYSLLIILILVVMGLFDGAKAGVIYPFLIYFNCILFKYGPKIKIFLVCSIVIIVVFTVINFENKSAINNFIFYFTNGFLNYKLAMINEYESHSYLLEFYKSLLGIENSFSDVSNTQAKLVLHQDVDIKTNTANAMATYYYYGGIYLMAVANFALGFMISKSVLSPKKLTSIFIYSIIMTSIILSIFEEYFLSGIILLFKLLMVFSFCKLFKLIKKSSLNCKV